MIAYIDSSILLRFALGQPNVLAEWRAIRRPLSSALAATECLRVLDRLRLSSNLSDADMAHRRGEILTLLGSLELIDLDSQVLNRAAQPMPTAMGTLDAIHLATALLWQESEGIAVTFATHDQTLARGARAHGLLTIGV